MRDDAGSWAGVSIEAVWASGDDPAAEIAGYAIANDVDLVVLGTRGSGMNRAGPLGSVSAAVMQRVDAPVLLVPPAIWTSLAPS